MLKDDFMIILKETVGDDAEHQPWISSIADRLVSVAFKYIAKVSAEAMAEVLDRWSKE